MRCTAALLSRTYVFAAFDGRWPGVTFHLALLLPVSLGHNDDVHFLFHWPIATIFLLAQLYS
jgi:hypothetical protein